RDVAVHEVDNRVGHGCLSWHLRGVDTKANGRRSRAMSAGAALLDRLGRPGDVRLGRAQGEPIRQLPTGLAALDRALGGGLPRGQVTELARQGSTGRTGGACAIVARAT